MIASNNLGAEICVYKTTQDTLMDLQKIPQLSWVMEPRAEHLCPPKLLISSKFPNPFYSSSRTELPPSLPSCGKGTFGQVECNRGSWFIFREALVALTPG